MKKYIQLLAAMMVAMFASTAMAFTPPPSPKPASNILDQAHVLTTGELRQLNTQLNQINANSANEIGVLIVPTLAGSDIRDVGIMTGKSWGVGKRDLDNGVMIVWSPGDRKIGIETGKGVEGDLPDLKCNDIIRTVMGPQFKNKQYALGLSQAFTAISGSIEDHRKAVAERDAVSAVHHSVPANDPVPTNTTTSPRSGGCDVSGAPVNQAGLGGGFVLIALLLVGFLVARGAITRRIKRDEQDREQQMKLMRQELERDRLAQETLRQNELLRQATAIAVQAPPAPVVVAPTPPVVVPVPTVVHLATDVVSSSTPTHIVAERIEELQRERAVREEQERLDQLQRERETRQAREFAESEQRARQVYLEQQREHNRLEAIREERRLREVQEERRQREVEEREAAALVAAAAAAEAVSESLSSDDDSDNGDSNANTNDDSGSYSTSSDDSSDDSSSNDDSSNDAPVADDSPDFGDGDFGGGGSADNY